MPKCYSGCLHPSLPVDTSPHFCPLCKKRFHAICSNSKYVEADKLRLTFSNSVLCGACAIASPHLAMPSSPFSSPGSLQSVVDAPGTRSSERIRKQQQHGHIPCYISKSVAQRNLFEPSQLTQFTVPDSIIQETQIQGTQPSVSEKRSSKLLISTIPAGMEVMNATACQGSTCKHAAQYKCYFKNSHIVVCHVCTNAVHVLCCLNSLLENKREFAMNDKFVLITCGIRGHNKILTEQKSGKKSKTKDAKDADKSGKTSNTKDAKDADDASRSYVSWHSDNPSNPEFCSMNILITWLTTQGNYSRYKGGDGQKGETKMGIAKDIASTMKERGCIADRAPKQIVNKVNELVRSYRDAVAFKIGTGQSHMSSEDMDNAVFGMCKYFSALDLILRERPSTQPLLTNKGREESAVKESADGTNDFTLVASSPESVKATVAAEKKIRSSKKKRDERKTLVPTKKRDKKDAEGAALMNLTKAMVNKYKCQERKLEMEEKHMSLKLRFETMQYRQQLKTLGVAEHEIDRQFPLPTMNNTIDVASSDTDVDDNDEESSSSETCLND